jgi:hypothetical protein
MTPEELYLLHAQRVALQDALKEATRPKPIVIPERTVEPPRSGQCAPTRTLQCARSIPRP